MAATPQYMRCDANGTVMPFVASLYAQKGFSPWPPEPAPAADDTLPPPPPEAEVEPAPEESTPVPAPAAKKPRKKAGG